MTQESVNSKDGKRNEEKWIRFRKTSIQMKNKKSDTEYPPNLQRAVWKLRRDSRGGLSSCSIRLHWSQLKQSVSGPLSSTFFYFKPPINAFISRLFLCSLTTKLALCPSKSSSRTSSPVRCLSLHQKTAPVQVSVSLSFQFPSRCG